MSAFFSLTSKAAVVSVAAAIGGEVLVHHIRTIYATPDEHKVEKTFPFETEQQFKWNIAALVICLVYFVLGFMALKAIIKCVQSSPHHDYNTPTAEEKLARMSMGPTQTFTNGLSIAGADHHPECTICLSEFVEGEGIRVLPKCKHGFHVKCIESWLLNRNSCPTCRTSCLKTSSEINTPPPPPGDHQQQQHNDVDVEAANPSETEMVPQQQQLNEVDIEAAYPPVTEIILQQQQQQQQQQQRSK